MDRAWWAGARLPQRLSLARVAQVTSSARAVHLVAPLVALGAVLFTYWGFADLYFNDSTREASWVLAFNRLVAKYPVLAALTADVPALEHYGPARLLVMWVQNRFFHYDALLNNVWLLLVLSLAAYLVFRAGMELTGDHAVSVLASVLLATHYAISEFALKPIWMGYHYVLVFSAASLWLFARYRNSGDRRALYWALAIWFVGMLFNEYPVGLIPFFLVVGAATPALRPRWLRELLPAAGSVVAAYVVVRVSTQWLSSLLAQAGQNPKQIPTGYALFERLFDGVLVNSASALIPANLVAQPHYWARILLDGFVALKSGDALLPRVELLLVLAFVVFFPMERRLRDACFIALLFVVSMEVPFIAVAAPWFEYGIHPLNRFAVPAVGGALLLAVIIGASWTRIQRSQVGDVGRLCLLLTIATLVAAHVLGSVEGVRDRYTRIYADGSIARAFDEGFLHLKPRTEQRPLYYAEIQGDLSAHHNGPDLALLPQTMLLMLSVYEDFPPDVFRFATENFRNNKGHPQLRSYDFFLRIDDAYAYGMVDSLSKAQRLLAENRDVIGVDNVYSFRWTKDKRFEDITADVRATLRSAAPADQSSPANR